QVGGGGPAEVGEPAVAVHPRLRNRVTVAVVLAGEPHGEGAVEDVRVAGAGQRLRQLVAGDGRGGVHGPGDGVAAERGGQLVAAGREAERAEVQLGAGAADALAVEPPGDLGHRPDGVGGLHVHDLVPADGPVHGRGGDE